GSQTETDGCQPLEKNTEWHWIRISGALTDASENRTDMPGCVYAVTSIARPQRFFHDLESGGLKLEGCQSYPDHHPFTEQDVCRILSLHPDIAVTAKDAVKLLPLWPKHRPLWVLPMQGSAQPGLLDTITAWLPQPEKKNPANT
ncbi:MAG: tetraacyldisaccharide 4'-kinase, partial [Mariprofundus sp.]